MARLAKFILPLILVVILAVYLANRGDRQVKIGFIACLTGRSAQLGVDGRDGVILAVKDANASGGIRGQRISLLVRDNALEPERALAAVNSLVDEGVRAIVGPMTSAMAMAVVPRCNAARIPIISPTVSTNELSGRDDWFFRIYNASATDAEILARYMRESLGHDHVCVIYDKANRSHTESWYRAFAASFVALGGREPVPIAFSSKDPAPDYPGVASRVAGDCSECLVILASSLDSAMFMQQLARLGKRPDHVIASEWSATEDVISLGGRSVEGMVFFRSYDPGQLSKRFLAFKKAFRETFGREPGFAAIQAYDAARIAIEALEEGDDPDQVKARLVSGRPFAGLQGPISIDRFGDSRRSHVMMTIRDGRFKPVEEGHGR